MNLLLLFAAVAILPKGAPAGARADSVVHDSIYKLAVNPADYSKYSVVYLLDEGVYRIEPNGHLSRTFRQVIQILKPQAASLYREQRFSYDPDREKLTINWMRVVKPNGVVVSGAPEQVQESDVPAPMMVPTYTSTKVRRLSLSGVDSGTVLDYSVTTEEMNPPMAGDFLQSWRVNPPTPVRRSLLVVDVPQSFTPKLTEVNLTFNRTEHTQNGRRTYSWATDNVLPPKVEIFAPDSSVKTISVTISAPIEWRSVGDWYAPMVAPRYAITAPVAAKIKTLVSGAKTLDDSIAAIQKWVSTDIRYVAILLGRGGYEPRDAETVTRTGFGDCKDKAMLFLAALRSIGVTGYPVLLNALGTVNEKVPAIEAFNHVIAAIQLRGATQYADLTVPGMSLGQLPPGEGGKFGVLVKEGASETVHLPKDYDLFENGTMRLVGAMDTAGIFTGTFEQTLVGSGGAFLQNAVKDASDSLMRKSMAMSLVRRVFDEADADSLTVSSSTGAQKSATVTLRVRNAKAGTEVANLWVVNNPVRPFTIPGRIAADLEKAGARTLPIDLSRVIPIRGDVSEVRMLLPAGWKAILPKSIHYSGLLGSFDLTYAQTGNELHILRTITGAKGVVGPDKIGTVIADLKLIGADNSKMIGIQKQ
jgi:hypothetical protein